MSEDKVETALRTMAVDTWKCLFVYNKQGTEALLQTLKQLRSDLDQLISAIQRSINKQEDKE